MKVIKYKGKVVNYTMTFTTIYIIISTDYNFRNREFNIVKHNEMYETYDEALSAIKQNATYLNSFLLKESNNEYKTIYQNNGIWKQRSYKIVNFCWDNKELEKRM